MTTESSVEFAMYPIGRVESPRLDRADDDWGDVESVIHLDAGRFTSESLLGLDLFSHVEVVFLFDQFDEAEVELGARHPRGRSDWPMMGIFAQRASSRPNRIGLTTCEVVGIDGLDLAVRGLDAIDGTPVLDIKPFVIEFQPRTPVRQPAWVAELMSDYW